jgi:hypothetical protein
MGTTILTIGVVWLTGFGLYSCADGSKSVRLRFKFEAGDKFEYRQITRGIIRAYDTDVDRLLTDEYAEVTMDIALEVRRVGEDSTAEILERSQYQSRTRNLLDTVSVDTVQGKPHEANELIKYMTPRGGIVDMEFASDTARGNIQYLKDYYRQGLPEFPDREIVQGESWTQTTRVVLPDGPVDASTTYTVKGFSREQGYDCVIIEYEGVSIIPLPPGVKEMYEVVSGADKIVSKGHLYFAYKEGAVVLIRERWVFDSDRVVVHQSAEPKYGYASGDTTAMNIGIEYDVDYHLIKMTP